MFEKEQLIDINLIDFDNNTYRISSDVSIANLKKSIQNNGMLNPCLVRKSNGRFIVISGHKRIIATKELCINQVPVKIVIEQENKAKTDLFCAKLSIIENAFSRELNLMEQARGVFLLSESLTNEEIATNSLSIFNSSLNPNIVEKLLKIVSLDKPVHDLILSKKLSINTALKLKNYDTQIFDAFINIFKKVRMGQNKQSEIIVNLYEIAKRDNIPLSELVNSKEIYKIIDHANQDENYKGNLLRSYLTNKRYPELTKTYDDHKKGIKDLKLEPKIKLNPPYKFEGENYSVSFEFRNKKEFEKHIQKLVSVYKSKAFENLIK